MQNSLKREVGFVGLAANTLNMVVGAGIFVLPALVSSYLGAASILAYIVCGLLMFGIVLCFAEVGSQITTTGGSYAYIQAAFGNYWGFLSNSLFWIGTGVIMNAAVLNAMADMLSNYVPSLQNPLLRACFFIILLLGFVWVNIKGVKHGNSLVKFNTLVKMIPLITLAIIGWKSVDSQNLAIVSMPTFESLGGASLMLFFAFGGGEAALSISGEIRNPSRNIPLGIMLGMGAVILLYVLLQLVAQGVLGESLVTYKDAPLAVVSERIFGKIGYGLIIAGGVYSIFGSLSGGILVYPRVIFGGATNGWLPKTLAQIHPRYATPHVAIIWYAVLVFGFAVSGGFKQLAIISSATLLLIYLGVVLAVIKFRSQGLSSSFRMPFGYLIPAVLCVVICWFLSHLKTDEVLAMMIFVLVLSLIYWTTQKSEGFKKFLRKN
jgi:basic amino acid/polyamine antiporter, APA family